jgi:predicted Zn-dependent protease
MSGCAVNPVTGKNEFSLVSEQQEIAMGQKLYSQSLQQQGGSYYLDPKVNTYINTIGQKLAALSHKPGLPYEFTVINSSVPNAWALPGGKIAINRGLLTLLDDEAQLAAVLGHEIVHVTARHGAQQQTQGMLLSMGSVIAQAAAGELGGVVSDTLQVGGNMVMAKYGRDDELESDFYGTRYLSAAGYDPQAAVELQKIFLSLKDQQSNGLLDTLFASHPPSNERMSRNQQTASTLPGSMRNRANYHRQLAQLFADQKAYQYYDEALKQHKKEDYAKAISSLNKAIKIQPRESEFWILKAQALWLTDQHKPALNAYNNAVKYNPGYFKPHLLRGLSHFDRGNLQQAETDLNRADRLYPTRVSRFYQGEIAFNRQQLHRAQQHYLAVAQGHDELAEQARDRLAKIQQLQQ